MADHQRLITAALALHHVDVIDDPLGFKAAWEAFSRECADYETVVAALPDVTRNDPGAFSRDAKPSSIRAAFSVPDRGSLRGRMLKLFAETDGKVTGWTDFELADSFARDPRTIGSCRRDLVLTGWVEEHGSVRCRPEDVDQKRPCLVHVLTDAGRRRYEELYADE